MAKKAKRPNTRPSKSKNPRTASVETKEEGKNPPVVKLAASRRAPANTDHPLSVVGIGASAGGLEASEQLLRALPHDTGLAFVLVQHLASKHESILSELLGKATRMPVIEVTQGMRVQGNHVYVIKAVADARQVRVALKLGGGALRIAITDNGKGIGSKEINDRKSFGIVGMRERVNRIAGEFNIFSSPGRGTRLEISVPLK